MCVFLRVDTLTLLCISPFLAAPIHHSIFMSHFEVIGNGYVFLTASLLREETFYISGRFIFWRVFKNKGKRDQRENTMSEHHSLSHPKWENAPVLNERINSLGWFIRPCPGINAFFLKLPIKRVDTHICRAGVFYSEVSFLMLELQV